MAIRLNTSSVAVSVSVSAPFAAARRSPGMWPPFAIGRPEPFAAGPPASCGAAVPLGPRAPDAWPLPISPCGAPCRARPGNLAPGGVAR